MLQNGKEEVCNTSIHYLLKNISIKQIFNFHKIKHFNGNVKMLQILTFLN